MEIDPRAAVQQFSDTCIRCGLCARTDCGNFPEETPNLGDICESLLSGDETWRHFPFTCALCNRCTAHCPAGLKAIDACKPLRGMLLPQHDELRPLYRKFRTDLKYNLFSALKARTSGDIHNVTYLSGTPDLGGEADHTAFFPGCSLYAYAPDLTEKVSGWLRAEKLAAYTLYFCCGSTFYDSGFYEEFERYRVRAQAFLADHKITRLIITCPHCCYELPQLLEGMDVEIVKLSKLLNDRSMTSGISGKISFHDACYDRYDGEFGELVRDLYPNAELVPLAHEKRDTMCCGGGGMVSVYALDYCVYRRTMRLAEVDETDADLVLSTCFSCVNSLQRSIGSTPVKHYLEPVFGIDVDWNAVYDAVDALERDPEYWRLTGDDNTDLTFDEA